jgi:hypothetical protein
VIEPEERLEFEQRSDEFEGQAERLEQQRDKVGGRIEEAKRDWDAKKSDSSVPGAVEDDLGVDEHARDPGEDSDVSEEPGERDESDDAPRSGDQSEAGQ